MSFSRVYIVSTGSRTGAWNMFFDTALLRLFVEGAFQERYGRNAALWRFYTWDPAAVSLGHGQFSGEIDKKRCRQEKIDIVRRPTGGRAVLHADEFTYSFFAETLETNAAIYAMVHDVIRLALRRLGVETEFCRSTPDMRRRYSTAESVSCFTASARNELQAGGRKLVGSAQRRSGSALLQHGSLPLSGNYRMLTGLLANGNPEVLSAVADRLERKTVSLADLTGSALSYDTLLDAMCRAIAESTCGAIRYLSEKELTALL
ncbi:lipoate--protein ligase family protein [Prosthecochloris sp. GSB1]|uniref:lipoate--protein ligase family protein n=1 Tax=Prosthecochloris sp. GSB1 TaxID=281093 RepID=UPI001F3142EF|nr:lipoate--protein ligase family protein [Prosthecochloris sp. GSB1]